MESSRTEAHQNDKRRRARRLRRLAIVNLSMVAVIIALVVFYLTMPGSRDGKPAEGNGNAASADSGAGDGGPQGNAGNTGEPGGDGSASGPGDASGRQDEDGAGSSGNNVGGQDEHEGGSAGDEGGTDQSDTGDDSGAPSQPAVDDAGETDAGGDGGTVKLAFVGDLLLSGSVEKLMEQHGSDYPYKASLSYLTGPDLTAGNLETPITERGVPAQNKQFVFKGSPKSLPALKEAGFDVVNLANNHTMDQGTEGLLDTIGHLNDAGIPNMGAGNDDAEAFTPVYLEAKGISVAYIGLTRVVPDGSWKADSDHAGLAETYDSTRAVKAIAAARKLADIVVVMVHWGIEREDAPNADQKLLAHQYIDAGADLVIGSHPHVLQGFETYKGKWISYSLGNYVFNTTKTPKSQDTGVLDAVCSKGGNCALQLHPMRLANWQPAPLNGEQAEALLKRVSAISLNATIDASGYVKEK